MSDVPQILSKIEPRTEQEAGRRAAIWLRVRLGGAWMARVAAAYGYRDGSGIHRVVLRLGKRAEEDRSLARRLKTLVRIKTVLAENSLCGPMLAIAPDGATLYAAGVYEGRDGTKAKRPHAVYRFTLDDPTATPWIGDPAAAGDGPSGLNRPMDVAVDQLGRVYVADNGNHRIAIFDSDGSYCGSGTSNGSEMYRGGSFHGSVVRSERGGSRRTNTDEVQVEAMSGVLNLFRHFGGIAARACA